MAAPIFRKPPLAHLDCVLDAQCPFCNGRGVRRYIGRTGKKGSKPCLHCKGLGVTPQGAARLPGESKLKEQKKRKGKTDG